MRHPRSWFLPEDKPVLAVLTAQWAAVEEALHLVWSWSCGTTSLADAHEGLKAAERREHDLRHTLHRQVRAAFWTPLDAEDIYELGERIGALLRQLHLLLREADASDTAPDAGLAGILSAVAGAAEPLGRAITLLPSGDAETVAEQAAERLGAVDHAYRVALTSVPHDDIRLEMSLRELYQRGERVADAAARVAHRTWYAICKIS